MPTSGLDTESNLEDHPVKSISESQATLEVPDGFSQTSNMESPPTLEAPDRFSQTSVSLHHGRRGNHRTAARGQTMCPDGVHVAGCCCQLVGKSSEHGSMIQLVTDLYEGRASSYLPVDIRRDRDEVEVATGFERAAGYGEIVLGDFIDMLQNVGAHAGQHFYDLGSGLGQLVFTAGLLGLDATGIEIVKQRHEQACGAVQRAEEQGIGHNHGSIKFLHGSFYDLDFSDADIVFINSVLFSDEMMRIISSKARSMKHGSRIFSYLSLPDAGRDRKVDGQWFRQLKDLSLRTTFSSGSPWKSYIAVNRTLHEEPLREEALLNLQGS